RPPHGQPAAQTRHVPVGVRVYERRPGLTGLLRQATKPGQDPYPGAVALGPTTHQRAVRHAAGRHLLPITHTSSRPGRLTKNIEAPPGPGLFLTVSLLCGSVWH